MRIICITGMARCGTSMVARILNIMGLYLGTEENLILQTDYNIKGCWEHRTLLEISESIVKTLTYHELKYNDWVYSPVIAALKEKAEAAIERDFGGVQLWGWKDDRCSLTLPFWQNILPDMEYVICVRNPVDVAKSLVKKNWAISDEEGMYRWLIFITSAIRNTHGRRRLIVFYEDFLSGEWKTAITRLAEFLGPSYAEKIPEYEDAIKGFISSDLQHYKTSIADMLRNTDIPYVVKHFYSVLYSHVKGKGAGGFNETVSDTEETLSAVASYANDEALRQKHLYFSLDEKNEKIDVDSTSIEDYERKIGTLSGQLEERDKRINDLLNSLSWKITAPLRRIGNIAKGIKE